MAKSPMKSRGHGQGGGRWTSSGGDHSPLEQLATDLSTGGVQILTEAMGSQEDFGVFGKSTRDI